MSKKIVSLVCLIAVIICVSVTVLLLFDNNNDNGSEEKVTDAIRFSQEYTKVGEKNLFVYRSAEEIVNILESGTGIVFLGFSDCPWCQAYAPMLNDIAMDIGIDKIFYCDIKADRANNSKSYKRIVELLGDFLDNDDEGKHRVYVPNVTIVKDGDILSNDNETSTIVSADALTPEGYWDEVAKEQFKIKLEEMIAPLSPDLCNKCNE